MRPTSLPHTAPSFLHSLHPCAAEDAHGWSRASADSESHWGPRILDDGAVDDTESTQPGVRIRLPEADSNRFTEIAVGIRLNWHSFVHIGEPRATSNLAQTHRLFPFEPVAQRVAAYIQAAFDNLLLWADFVAPTRYHPEQVTYFTLRPGYTLGRAALESASQAVWLLSTTDPMECVRRHISLMRWDLVEHRKFKVGDEVGKDEIKAKEAELVARVSAVFTDEQVASPRSYLQVITDACAQADLQMDPVAVERLWRAASGAAHGKFWPTEELQRQVTVEDYHTRDQRSQMLPDTSVMGDLLDAAFRMTQYAALRYADYAGADITALYAAALTWVSQELPLREGVNRADLLQFAREGEERLRRAADERNQANE